jgi:amino acid adenylation domain-containing protein
VTDATGADLLAARLARRPGRTTIPAHAGSSAPLTATQEGMWFEAQVDPARPRHHRPIVIRWRGPVDPARLRVALAQLVVNHPTLTTSYPLIGLRPRQQPRWRTDPTAGARGVGPVEDVDLVVMDGRRDRRAADRAVVDAASRAFDLVHAGPLAATLVTRADADHLLVLALSHLALDGPSAEVLVADLAAVYAGDHPEGRDEPADPRRTSFADWAAWQDDRLSPERREDQLEWWSRLLAHHRVSDRLELTPGDPNVDQTDDSPVGRSPSVSGTRVGTVRLAEDGHELGWVAVPPDVTDALRGLARVESVTMHAVTLAAFQALWWSQRAVDDLVVGVPVSDRDHPDLDAVVGCFVRVLPVRLRAGPDDTGRDLVRRASALTQVVLDHRAVSLPEITAAVGARLSDGAATDVVDSHFQYRRQGSTAIRAGDATLELETVMVAEAGPSVLVVDDGWELSVATAAPGGGAAHARQLAEHMVAALSDLVRGPDRPIRPIDPDAAGATDLDVLDAAGQPDRTLVDLFERTVAAHGSRPGGRDGEEVVTYAELDRRARAVAARLQELGVVAGDPVVLALERSMEWLVSMLGVVLAGGVYVPVDPTAPAERTAAMVADVAPRVVIHPGAMRSADVASDLEPGTERVAGWSARGPDAPVYVLFTSGSTGRPKGVAVTHANVVQLVEDPGYMPMSADDVVLFSANPTFDGTTIEVWGALAAGACVALFDPDTLVDPERLEVALRDWGVTVMGITTALFQAVARHRPGAFASLRLVAFGGEACDPRWVRAVVAAGPPVRLMHDYGPTETTCAVAYHDVRAAPEPGAVVPMGRSLAQATLHVLDPRGRPVVPGVPGELYIGGPGVALGYVRRPELTAERFVTDPFSSRPGARLYRSGDLVVQRPDGVVEFLGRLDTQIKIRGFRVELGEIEAALADHPDVDLAAVQPWWPDPTGEPSLVAYVVLRPGTSWDDGDGSARVSGELSARVSGELSAQVSGELSARVSGELSAHLASRLPPYMHPRVVVRLDSMPLTGNGKLDRRALPEPTPSGRGRAGTASAGGSDPRHPDRQGPDGLAPMIELWRSVLETDWIGPDDHFFDVGGHSLRAMALLAAIRDEFRVDLRVADLASADTPRTLARVVADQDLVTSPDGVIELHPGPLATEPVLFIPAGVAIHYLTEYRRLAQHLDLARPALTFEPPGMAPGSVPRSTMGGLARWYWRLIERHQPRGPVRLVGHSLGGSLALEVARQARRSGREVAALVLLDPRLPPEPATGVHLARVVASATVRRARAELARASTRADAARPARQLDQDLRVAAGQALARYRPRPWDGAVTLAVAMDRDREAGGRRGGEAMLARWTPVLAGLTVVELPGSHVGPDSILAEPHVAGTADAVRPTLA